MLWVNGRRDKGKESRNSYSCKGGRCIEDEEVGESQLGAKERKSRGEGQNVLSRWKGCWKKELNTFDLIELSSDLEVYEGSVD